MGLRVVHSTLRPIPHPIRIIALVVILVFAALLVMAPAPARAETRLLQPAETDGIGNAAIAPGSSTLGAMDSRLHAPDLFQASSNLGYVGLAWDLDYDDTGNNPINPDEEQIDHFNVYCDGRLVVQVDISAVIEEVHTYYDGSRSHYWYFAYDPGDRWALHNFQISSVAKDGTEGYLSETWSAEAKRDDIEVVGHQASASTTAIGLEFKVLAYYSLGRFDVWRSSGTTPPDTNAAPYVVIPTNRHPDATSWDYWDENVVANTTYTYTVRATDSEGAESNFYTFTVIAKDDAPSFNSPSVHYELVNNTTPTLTFTAYNWDDKGYSTVYKLYRNNTQIDSFKGAGSHSFADTPTADGTYTYRVDLVVAGFTVRGREYTFTRNTKPADLPSKPDAPSLAGRLDGEHKVTLAWTPSATGGEVEGYHIYRKDAGAFVEGSYRQSNGYFYLWGMNRYLDVSADTTAFADVGIPGATDAYLGDYEKGRLTEVWWGDTNAPHEYYVTAYNEYGESAPSNVVVFPYAGGSAPANGDARAPGAPTVKWAWIEWWDSSDWYQENEGAFDPSPGYVIRVAWDEPEGAATTVGSYRVTFDDGNDVHEASVPRYGLLNGLRVQDGTSEYSPQLKQTNADESDYNKDIQITVYAVNEAGETASAPLTFHVDSPPRIYVASEGSAAVVRWADPVSSTATVTGWELYKRPEHGLLAKVGSFGAGTYEYTDADVLDGWTYTYYVVAKTSAGDCQSAWVSKLITTEIQDEKRLPGAPTNLKATVVNGRVVLSWTRPAYEGSVSYYYAEFKYPGSDEWVLLSDQGSARFVRGSSEGMTIENVGDLVDKDMQVRVFAHNAYYATEEGDGPCSNVATFKITSEQAAAHAEGVPGTVRVSGEAGEAWCKVMWSTSGQTGKAPATEYRIKRSDTAYGAYSNYATIGTVAAKGDGSYDYEYVDRTAENGRTYRYMVYPANSGTEALVDANYDYVELSPTAKTHDQQVAEMVAGFIADLPAPDDVTAADAERIGEVKAIWDGLSDDQQKLVKEVDKTLPKKLSDDVQALADLELLERYRDVLEPVQAKIDALPAVADVTLAHEPRIVEARSAYDSLPAEVKRLVKRLAKLTDAEQALRVLRCIDISNANVTFSPTSPALYTGKPIQLDVTVKVDGVAGPLARGVDFFLRSDGAPLEVGKYAFTVQGVEAAGYTGSATAEFEITSLAASHMATDMPDLDANDWYMNDGGRFQGSQTLYLDYTLAKGLMSGYKKNGATYAFGPSDKLTRAQTALILFRIANPGEDDGADENATGLADVKSGMYYTKAVNWAFKNGIVTGYKDTSGRAYAFGPDDPVTREQLATMIARFCGKHAGTPMVGKDVSAFPDGSSIADWAREGAAFCAANGIITGYGGAGGKFGPQDLASRCQMAKIIAVAHRLIQ